MTLRNLLFSLLLGCSCMAFAGHKVIAHRGYWTIEGASQNSRASLQQALNLGVYGSETDVWLTTDGHIMVNHDPSYKGVELQKATYRQCKKLMLGNGERMPQLKDLLKMLRKSASPTKLIIEIKGHATPELNKAAAQKVMKEVRKYGVAHRVEYISFNMDACLELISLDKDAKVAYLDGKLAPAELHKRHFTGLDYHIDELRRHPEWIAEAHQLGMTVNVWTVDKPAEIDEMSRAGVDYITTNNPVEAR